MCRLGAIALCVLWTVSSWCQAQPCTQELAEQADEAVDGLKSWDRIHDWYLMYRECDDGGPAEGVSEAVARNLVDRWQTLPRLAELTKDAAFHRFVLNHLDETINAGDLKKISVNAKKRCPASLRNLCQELARQADAR